MIEISEDGTATTSNGIATITGNEHVNGTVKSRKKSAGSISATEENTTRPDDKVAAIQRTKGIS